MALSRRKLDELFGIDLRTLALVRICTGLLIFVDLGIRALDLRAHYTDEGVIPRSLLAHMTPEGSLFSPQFLLGGDVTSQGLLFALTAVCALALAAGYRTRLATIVLWVLLTGLHRRNPLINHGGDAVMTMILVWGAFLPLGARFSIDALRRPWRRPQTNDYRSVATFALLLQICFVYWFAVARRTTPIWWQGEAVHYALQIDLLAKAPALLLREIGPVLPLLTWTTLAIEIFAPLIAFSPFRTVAFRLVGMALMIGLSVNFGLFLNLGTFPYMSIGSWLVFLPGPAWDRWLEPLGRRLAARLRLDSLAVILERRFRPADARVEVARPERAQSALLTNLAAALLFCFVVAVAVRGAELPGGKLLISDATMQAAKWLRVHQPWAMFTPSPLLWEGWYVMPGRLTNGEEVEMLTGARPPRWEKPPLVVDTLPSQRWGTFLLWARVPKNHYALPPTASYFCRRWNREHTGDEALESLEIYFMREITPPPGLPATPPEKTSILRMNCKTGAVQLTAQGLEKQRLRHPSRRALPE